MQKLQEILRNYNLTHINDMQIALWEKMYCENEFPKYWFTVYDILAHLNRNYSIIEIGCGLGNVTAIPCYLGFKRLQSFERDKDIAFIAQRRIKDLFNLDKIIIAKEFPDGKKYSSDILILVNCVYSYQSEKKGMYLERLKSYYYFAGNPRFFILEVIDSSYIEKDEVFPYHIRLQLNDIKEAFPKSRISSWLTYRYPINRRSKRLYLIERV